MIFFLEIHFIMLCISADHIVTFAWVCEKWYSKKWESRLPFLVCIGHQSFWDQHDRAL